MSIFIHKSLDPTWPRWAVSGRTNNTQWFKTLAEAESFAGFKFIEPQKKVCITEVEHAALIAVADLTIKMQAHFASGGSRSEYIALDAEINQALATLSAVRQNGVAQ